MDDLAAPIVDRARAMPTRSGLAIKGSREVTMRRVKVVGGFGVEVEQPDNEALLIFPWTQLRHAATCFLAAERHGPDGSGDALRLTVVRHASGIPLFECILGNPDDRDMAIQKIVTLFKMPPLSRDSVETPAASVNVDARDLAGWNENDSDSDESESRDEAEDKHTQNE